MSTREICLKSTTDSETMFKRKKASDRSLLNTFSGLTPHRRLIKSSLLKIKESS